MITKVKATLGNVNPKIKASGPKICGLCDEPTANPHERSPVMKTKLGNLEEGLSIVGELGVSDS